MGATTPNRSPEIRLDSLNDQWVIFSPGRARRPSDFKAKSNPTPNNQSEECPFCAGHEHECAPEIFRVPEGPTSESHWKVRVIQNLYPALSRNIGYTQLDQNPRATHDHDLAMSGFGFHDVVIESPVHSVQLWDLSPFEIAAVLLAYKQRIQQLLSIPHIEYIQVFKNYGASAGASMSHSHSQIMALPVVPKTFWTRVKSMQTRGVKCFLCDIKLDDCLINESTHFIAVAPFASAYPFEIWIVPRYHSSHFHELDEDKAVDLGRLLKLVLRKIHLQLNNPPFNFMIHTSPVKLYEIHWFLQIVPQLSGVGGFELGTGTFINPVFPEDAAKVLREINLPD